MTFIFLDVETTGIDPKNNSIIQLAGIIKSEKGEEKFNYRMAPYHDEEMTEIASEKTGLSTEDVYKFPDQKKAFFAFKDLLDFYITSYDTKAYLVGYNVAFDDSFMREWFELNNAKWGYEVWFPYIDVMTLAGLHLVGARPHMKNFQLTTVYNVLTGKELIGAHDAFADIAATKELFELLTTKILGLEKQESIPVRKRKLASE